MRPRQQKSQRNPSNEKHPISKIQSPSGRLPDNINWDSEDHHDRQKPNKRETGDSTKRTHARKLCPDGRDARIEPDHDGQQPMLEVEAPRQNVTPYLAQSSMKH